MTAPVFPAPGSTLTHFAEIGSGGPTNTVTGIKVKGDGFLLVLDNGIVNSSTISSGGIIDLHSHDPGSLAFGNAITISSGGEEFVKFNGVDTNAVINNFGEQLVLFGGFTLSATVNFGGLQFVGSGGVAEATQLKGLAAKFATQFVASGGVADDTVVSAGGLQQVGGFLDGVKTPFFGGVANNTLVLGGGTE